MGLFGLLLTANYAYLSLSLAAVETKFVISLIVAVGITLLMGIYFVWLETKIVGFGDFKRRFELKEWTQRYYNWQMLLQLFTFILLGTTPKLVWSFVGIIILWLITGIIVAIGKPYAL